MTRSSPKQAVTPPSRTTAARVSRPQTETPQRRPVGTPLDSEQLKQVGGGLPGHKW